MHEDTLTKLFCEIDDFINRIEPHIDSRSLMCPGKRERASGLSNSEIVTILVSFHIQRYRTFKQFYLWHVREAWRSAFPTLPSYSRFVSLMPRVTLWSSLFLNSRCGSSRGVCFIDSTKISVCHNKRISRNKVFKDVAAIGKTTVGWFYGFKLHLIINDQGELVAVRLTPGNVDDRAPVVQMTNGLCGILVGDKGYISQPLLETLLERGLRLITPIRKNMKNKLLLLAEKFLVRKRSLIETVNDQLKNLAQIEHSRHRSVNNFVVHLVCGLIAYSLQPKKPSLKQDEIAVLRNFAM